MVRFQVNATPAAAKDFDRLPHQIQDRFRMAFPRLAQDPWKPRSGCHIEPLEGEEMGRKLRIGHYRGIYQIVGNEVLFTRFGHRPTVYR